MLRVYNNTARYVDQGGNKVLRPRSCFLFCLQTNGVSNGVIPMVRVYNECARHVSQGAGKVSNCSQDSGRREIFSTSGGHKIHPLDRFFNGRLILLVSGSTLLFGFVLFDLENSYPSTLGSRAFSKKFLFFWARLRFELVLKFRKTDRVALLSPFCFRFFVWNSSSLHLAACLYVFSIVMCSGLLGSGNLR